MKPDIRKQLARFLAEDIGSGDITSALLPNKTICAKIISRQNGVIAGTKFAKELFAMKKCKCTIKVKDGQRVTPNQTIMMVCGNAKNILATERVVLNLLARMSGIATQTRELADKLPKGVQLLATRKTAPGLRFFDKEAVKIGGGGRHRIRLDDAIMIKDNHLAIQDMQELINKAKNKKIEIEVESKKDAIRAAQLGVSIIMLDNFTPSQITSTIKELEKLGLRKSVKIEISGGINASNIKRYAKTKPDMISVGSITNSVKGIDLSLEV